MAYQLSAFEDLPREIEKARQCCISTGLLRKAFHRSDVTSASIRRIDELAIANLETMARFDDYRSRNRKSLLSLHCSDSVDSCGNAKEYSTAPFESKHRGIRLDYQFAIASFDQRHIPSLKSSECRFNCAPEADGFRTLPAAAVSFIIHRGRDDGSGHSSKFRHGCWLL